MRAFALVPALLALALPAAVASTATLCEGGDALPVLRAGTLQYGDEVAFGITGVEGQGLVVEVHSAQVSHGHVAWALRAQGSGDVLAQGRAFEFSLPVLTPPSPSDSLCLEVRSLGTLVRHYVVAVSGQPG